MAPTELSVLDALLMDWQQQLSLWASSGELSLAAQEALFLEQEPELLKELVRQWSQGDFSNLPPVVLLPAANMPGAAGAYAASTGTIYLNQDWLQRASREQAVAVLTEELGHHFVALLNSTDSPGDEGKVFANHLLSDEPVLTEQGSAALAENDTGLTSVDDTQRQSKLSSLLNSASPSLGSNTNPFYKYQLIAKTGDLGIQSIKREVSLNNRGDVALIGSGFSNDYTVVTGLVDSKEVNVVEDHIFVHDGTVLKDISPDAYGATRKNSDYGFIPSNALGNYLNPLGRDPSRTYDLPKASYFSIDGLQSSESSGGIQITNDGSILVRRIEDVLGYTDLGARFPSGSVYPYTGGSVLFSTPQPKLKTFIELWDSGKLNTASPKSQAFPVSFLYPDSDTFPPPPRFIPLATYKPDYGTHGRFPSANNVGQILFRSIAGGKAYLTLYDPRASFVGSQLENSATVQKEISSDPMGIWAADNGTFLTSQNGILNLLDSDLKTIKTFDDSSLRIGNYPRISDDGNAIAFCGARDGKPGIYLAIKRFDDWEVVEVAKTGDSIHDFIIDSPVGVVTHSVTVPDTDGNLVKIVIGATIVYMAKGANGDNRLLSTRVSFDSRQPAQFSYEYIHAPKLLFSSASNIDIYDPINENGEIVFWVGEESAEKVIKTTGSFDIDIVFPNPSLFSSEQKAEIFNAVTKWESVIATDIPSSRSSNRDVIDDIVVVFDLDKQEPLPPGARADSKFQRVLGFGCRLAIASSALMSCITACMPERID